MRYFLVLLLFACGLFACGSVARAGDHPRWADLADRLGEAKDSKKVSSFVGSHSLSEVTKGPFGSFSSEDRAYSLMYRKNRICTIVLQVDELPEKYSEEHWKPYSEKLPGKLSAQDGRAEVIEKLGDPVKDRKNTWRHDDLYIWVHFDKEQKGIEELFVSEGIIEAPPKPSLNELPNQPPKR